MNIDESMANQVALGLRLAEMPQAAKPARKPISDLLPRRLLSVIKNGPSSFAGRMVGVLVTDGVDGTILQGLKDALKKEGAMAKIVSPQIGGVKDAQGELVKADYRIDGGPSVLFDAVAVLPSKKARRCWRICPR